MTRERIELSELRDLMDRWRRNLDEGRQLARRTGDLARRSAARRPWEVKAERDSGSRWPGIALGTALGIAAGAAIGLIVAFLADPDSGRRRRAMLADRAAAGARDVRRSGGRLRRSAMARADGVLAGARPPGDGAALPNDASLADRVETELFRDPAVPKGQMNINVEDGIVVIRGEIGDSDFADALTDRAARIPGVRGVENLLHPPGQEPIGAIPHNELEA